MTLKFVSVAICTWNRAAELDRTLATLCDLSVPPDLKWELVVVNNNSTDDTDSVIERYAGRLPIVPFFEPRQGVAHARNLAAGSAAGDLIVFTDDDVLVDPGWLKAYVEAAGRWPLAAYFGGPITLAFDAPPTRRQVSCLHWSRLGNLNLGDVEQPLARGHEFYGANMAFRRFVFERWRFDVNFGRVGELRLAGEEGLLILQLQEHGLVGVCVPAAKVQHRVTADQLTNAWLYRNWVGLARTYTRRRLSGWQKLPTLRKLWLALSCLTCLSVWTVGRMLSLDLSVKALCKTAWHHGVLAEVLRSLRGKGPN